MDSRGSWNRLSHLIVTRGFYLVFIILAIFYSFASKPFLSVMNIRNIFLDAASVMMVCTGLSFVVITGNLDLSVGSVAFFSASITVLLIKLGQPVLLCILTGILAGTAISLINGSLVVLLKLDSLLVTLGMMIGLRGVCLLLNKGVYYNLSSSIKRQAVAKIGPVPLIVILVLLLLIIGQIILSRTTFGRNMVAVGCSKISARKVGLKVRFIQFAVFVISSLCAAIGGIIMMMNLGAYTPRLGSGAEFIAIAAIVMGGTSLFGGQGSIIPGALAGALMLGIIENGLALLSVSPFAYPLVRGVVIFIAMYADSWKNSKLAMSG